MADTSNWFEISPYFSFRWVDNDVTSPYNTLPLYAEIDDLNYYQQVQCGGDGYQSDIGQIHVASSFVLTCKLYDFVTDLPVKTVSLEAIDPPVLGVDFIYYIGQCDFSDVDPGLYYLKITYTDQDEAARDWRTSPLDVAIYHEGTQRIEATNTYNDKGVVFVNTSGYNWSYFRVASYIATPLVKTDAQDYEDQYNDLTQETSIPFVTYTQCIGGPLLLPFWVIEKINLLYSLNSVLIDGQPFTKLANAEFKPTRDTKPPQGAWWEVDIQPNNSYPAEIYVTADPGPDTIREIKMEKTYTNISADFTVTGIFTALTNLIRVAINNVGGDEFTLTLSDGGDWSFEIDVPSDFDDSIDVGKLFLVPTDVPVTGVAGTNCTLIFDYNDYLAPVIPIKPTASQKWQKNTLYYFVEITPGSFADEFDVTTGLGRVGTDHEGCALANTNGTPDITGLLVRGWDSTEILPIATRQTVTGSNSVTIATGNIPAHTHNAVNGDVLGAGPGNDISVGKSLIRKWDSGINMAYNLQGTTTQPDRGVTSSVGNGDALDITNRAIILPAFYYIGT